MRKFKNPDVAILILRIFVALIFILHGVSKFSNIEGTRMFFEIIGFPAILGPIVAGAEILFGIMMLTGFGTAIASLGIMLIMLVAIIKVKMPMGGIMSAELDASMFISALVILMTGAGKYALGRKCGCVGSCGCDSNSCEHGVCVDDKCVCDCHATDESKKDNTQKDISTESKADNSSEHHITI